ncbi:MAG: hypothetical protein LBE53_09350 [Paucimonas sp.]|jgi:hypothetical protein|nr:hypothetical protein [Paucimonas sp.]
MPTSRINTAGVQYVRDHLASIPRPDLEARNTIKAWLLQQHVHLEPEQIEVVTLHVHTPYLQTPLAVVTQRVPLVQAVLMNWQGESANDLFGGVFRQPWAGNLPQGPICIVEHLPPQPLLDNGAWYQVFNGLFQRCDSPRYDQSTLVPIRAERLLQHIETLDIHTRYRSLLDTYWQSHMAQYRLSCKLNFIAACNRQVDAGSLDDAARRLVWRAAGLLPRGRKLRLSTLSIYGYAATDALYINDASNDLTVLYLPGNSSPFLTFASETAMKDWVGQQCRDPAKRTALKQYFRLADGPQGLDFSGLDTALEGLGAYPASHRLPPEHGFFNDDGTWSPRTYVNYRPGKYNPKITGDLFQAMAERRRQRTYDDADFIITSNSEVTKARWRGYLNATLNLLAPLSLVIPGLAPLLALGGIAQLGLGLDAAINGRSLAQRQDGVGNIAWGLFNSLPLAVHGAIRGKSLFEFKADGFVTPSRLNDGIGYPLSPVGPMHLPDIDVAPYFHVHDPIAPLPEGDQAIADSVVRVPKYDGTPDNLDTRIDSYNARVIYDMERDVFIHEGALNEVEPVGYIARPGSANLVPAPRPRLVTNAMRTRSLRALGIDLPLPVQMPARAAGSSPIPQQISCLWVGDKVISPALRANLASNAARLQDSPYGLRLFLSSASPAVYAENLRLLTEQAPALNVLPLEEQVFFRTFQQSKYHAQYQAALDGNGGVATNYASASDVLRYPMLHHEGGLYMDVDDQLLAPGEPPLTVNGQALGNPAQAIDLVELHVPADGLLLAPPMSNEKMSMNCLYNTSLIGSHAGNPTLEAISEEMYLRYQDAQDFYDSKPDLAEDPAGFYRYASRLSRLTGPALLTDVVDQRLPDLRTLRQIMNLYTMPRINSWQFVNLEHYQAALRQLLPLNRFARVGGNHSWART